MSAAFWSLYQQQFTVVTIYSDTRLVRNLFGWEMPVSWVQSIAIGTALSGTLAKYYSPESERPYFAILGLIAIAVGAALASPALRRLMSGVR